MLDISKSPLIMGILNYTTDSFSDGGLYNSPEAAVSYAIKMQNNGADIIDFGACSTRPGCQFISETDELNIIDNIIPEIKKYISIPISVDSFYLKNQLRSIELGVEIINDVSGVYNSQLADAVKNSNVYWIIMHGGVLTENKGYDDILHSVQIFFDETYEKALSDGIEKKIILDPGFGFKKNTKQNKTLLLSLDKLNTHGLPLLCGLSRKRFVGELSDDSNISDRLGGTLTANLIALHKGALILRVHDVLHHKNAVNFLNNIQ